MANQTPDSAPRDDSADWEAIASYHAGEGTSEERDAVRRWLDAHPDQAAAFAALNGATGQLTHATPPGLDVEAALRRVSERRDTADVIPIGSRRPKARPVAPTAPLPWQRIAIPAAAAAVLAVGAGLYWHSATTGVYTQPALAQYVTSVGQRDSVRLADGTRVVLAPESRLTVAAGYGINAREVELRGEAYFDVPHDASRPFLVRAAGAAIRDLGTTFTVRTAGDTGVRVVVTSGLVSIAPAQAAASAAVTLQPGDAGTLGADGRTLVERGGAAEPDTAWTRGRLVFQEAPLATVRAELRRWYGIDLQVDSSFASQHLSMTFDGESADRVLEVVALSLGARVSRHGATAVLSPAAPRSQ